MASQEPITAVPGSPLLDKKEPRLINVECLVCGRILMKGKKGLTAREPINYDNFDFTENYEEGVCVCGSNRFGYRVVTYGPGGTVVTAVAKPSMLWYLVPIFLTFIGGIVMLVMLWNRDRTMGLIGFVLGFLMTGFWYFVFALIIAAPFL